MSNHHHPGRPTPNPTGDLIVSDNRLGVGTTDNLSTLTVRARASFTLTGTLSKTAASETVTGTSTKFLSELSTGDRITVGSSYDATKAVVTVDSDTSLTVDSAYVDSEANLTVQALPSAARVDDAAGNPQVNFTDQGNIGIGTMAPNAQLEVSGEGSGEFGGCPVNIRAHSGRGGDAWNLVLSYGSPAGTPGVAMWVDDLDNSGFPTLSYTFFDGVNTMADTLRVDINGLHLPGALTTSPVSVSHDYEIGSNDQYLYVDAAAGARTVLLPFSGGNAGRVLWIFKIDPSANPVGIAVAANDTINGATVNRNITTQYGGIKLVALTASSITTWVASALPPA